MNDSLTTDYLPELTDPLLIAGFEGWGNALDISKGMVDYILQKLEADLFATIDPDLFYRFDENRPIVEVKNGYLEDLKPPESAFYVIEKAQAGRDLIIFRGIEPSIHWFQFIDCILELCENTGVGTVVSIGSMYDNVLHTDKVVSAVASSPELLKSFKEKDVTPVNYKGPSAIHSTLHSVAQERGFECLSIWCHCPYYLQGTTHFGLLAHLGALLSSWAGFSLDTEELETTWGDLSKQIQGLIDKNPELQSMISDLRKAKVRGAWTEGAKGEKVIRLEDFLKPKP